VTFVSRLIAAGIPAHFIQLFDPLQPGSSGYHGNGGVGARTSQRADNSLGITATTTSV